MRLTLTGVLKTGTALLDDGITDLEARLVGGVVQLYTSTGPYGGLVAYEVGATGAARIESAVLFPPEIAGVVSGQIALADDALLVGARSAGLISYALTETGALGARGTVAWSAVDTNAATGDAGDIDALALIAATTAGVSPAGPDFGTLADLETVTLGGTSFVLGADLVSNGVVVSRVDTATGTLSPVATMGAAEGLGVALPTALEVVTLGGQTYALLAAAGSSSISVLRVGPTGALQVTDHVVDTGNTRFEDVQALAATEVGGRAFVVAGGSDNGITLFELLSDGRLVTLQTIADGSDTALHKVTALEMIADATMLHVFAGSQNEAGVTQFTVDLSDLGVLRSGGDGLDTIPGTPADDVLTAVGAGDVLSAWAGDDILVSGTADTRMTGGLGGDLFVIREGSGTTSITDFQRGADALDLSDLPMLRDVSQLSISVRPRGAIITYRGVTVVVTASDNQPLTVAELFPQGFAWADHFDFYPATEVTELPDETTEGNDTAGGSDTATGGAGDDSTTGGETGGADTTDGGDTNPPDTETIVIVEGGSGGETGGTGNDSTTGGNDTGSGSGTGNDTGSGGGTTGQETITIPGGGGGGDTATGGGDPEDEVVIIDPDPPARVPGLTLAGTTKSDVLKGGAHDDTLAGDKGNDTLWGYEGYDEIDGGIGKDWISGGEGNDTLWGGASNDTLLGDAGDDLLYGGAGKNLLEGGEGDDTLHGDTGKDTLRGGAGHDVLHGGGGHDLLETGDGDSTAYGGSGNDTIQGGSGDDALYGEDGKNRLYGGAGNDAIHAGSGKDLIEGGDGNDEIHAGEGKNQVYGGAGDDTIITGGGKDLIDGGDGNDEIRAGAGKDVITTGSGNNTVYAGADADKVTGGIGNDLIYGDEGKDTIDGGAGNDTIYGGADNDALRGGAGNDVLWGGAGADQLWGDGGADTFEFYRADGTARIMDFNPGEGDTLQLDDWIWLSDGDLSAADVVDRFGSVDSKGNVVLDFGDVGGGVVLLDGFGDLDALADHIEIV